MSETMSRVGKTMTKEAFIKALERCGRVFVMVKYGLTGRTWVKVDKDELKRNIDFTESSYSAWLSVHDDLMVG